jgi:hypothetical protein
MHFSSSSLQAKEILRLQIQLPFSFLGSQYLFFLLVCNGRFILVFTCPTLLNWAEYSSMPSLTEHVSKSLTIPSLEVAMPTAGIYGGASMPGGRTS